VKPAGNWRWELEIENDETIAVIIGWSSTVDADKAEKTYLSIRDIQYRRQGTVTGYVRGSDRTGVAALLHNLYVAASGGWGKGE
jgi:hypothetical protein